jgi:hypothetical protein
MLHIYGSQWGIVRETPLLCEQNMAATTARLVCKSLQNDSRLQPATAWNGGAPPLAKPAGGRAAYGRS